MAAKKQRRMRVGAKTATKMQERDIIENARAVRDKPELIFPVCGNPDCKKCIFEKSKKKVEKVHKSAGNPKKLTAMSKSSFIGDERARAYAATLLVSHAENAPFLARAQTPFGEANFAIRGKAKKEFLTGIQNFESQGLRVSHVLGDVAKHDLHIYSDKNKMVCTGKDAKPPADYVRERIGALKVELSNKDSNYCCPHLDVERALQHEPAGVSYVVIRWTSANVSIVICKECAAKAKENTIVTLAKYIAAKDALHDFSATIITKDLVCQERCEKCQVEGTLKTALSGSDYAKENEADIAIIKKYEDRQRENEALLFVIGNTCYGTNLEKFLQDVLANSGSSEALADESSTGNFMRDVLTPALQRREKSISLPHGSLSKLLSAVWEDVGRELIAAYIGDKTHGDELFDRGVKTPDDTVKIIREAQEWARYRAILNELPSYDSLSPLAAFADRVAKTYKVQGADAAEKIINERQLVALDENIKILSYAFLVALDKHRGKEWQYGRTQQESGIVIAEYAKALLGAEADAYNEAFQNVLAAVGSTEKVQQKSSY